MNEESSECLYLECGVCGRLIDIRRGDTTIFCGFCGGKNLLRNEGWGFWFYGIPFDENNRKDVPSHRKTGSERIDGESSPEVRNSNLGMDRFHGRLAIATIAVIFIFAVFIDLFMRDPSNLSKAETSVTAEESGSGTTTTSPETTLTPERPVKPDYKVYSDQENLELAKRALSNGDTEKARGHAEAISTSAPEFKAAETLKRKISAREERDKVLAELKDAEARLAFANDLEAQTRNFTSDFGRMAYNSALYHKREALKKKRELEKKLRSLR